MNTVGDLIKASFYRTGIRDSNQEIEGDDITRGIDILNMLMHRLEADGLQISWKNATFGTGKNGLGRNSGPKAGKE